ncbi:MAG: threonylcarbamoyl-AMP synthase [Bacteroidetes bacterium]|jgi:tRNA threonylcarbamoyl adenosine modification protein (Sua5/YciO/YrdC/YwlC family)|nr:threonylcarbamoyl-AMP synthase [Bacteroidota bacterium]
MILKIHPKNPEPRKIAEVVAVLAKGGVAIVPTDTIYAFVCDLSQYKGFEKICRIKGIKPEKANFSLLCKDLSNISNYTKPFDRSIYKLLNKALPGPYTFLLEASNEVPSLFRSKKKTIGLRVPDHPIIQEIIEALGRPLVSTSLHDLDEIVEYPSDPELIAEQWESVVDIVVDGDFGHIVASTIIDCTSGEAVLLREGAGSSDIL